jgi:hypothetical protein
MRDFKKAAEILGAVLHGSADVRPEHLRKTFTARKARTDFYGSHKHNRRIRKRFERSDDDGKYIKAETLTMPIPPSLFLEVNSPAHTKTRWPKLATARATSPPLWASDEQRGIRCQSDKFVFAVI